MKDYKQEIEETRIGCLGSSDAKMVAQIATLGSVPKSAYERMARLKGYSTHDGHPISPAMRFGDRMENEIFGYLHFENKEMQSNPMWESEKYSRSNFKCISHPDYVWEDETTKVIYVYEVKTSKLTNMQVRQEYRCQLYWHHALAMERARAKGDGWRHKLFLVHYNSFGIEDFDAHEFDSDRLLVKEVRFHTPVFNMELGLDIIDAFLDDFKEYYCEDEIDANLLPEQVYEQFNVVCNTLSQIKEMEEQVEAFKQRIYAFMLEKGIKSIKNDVFAISRVDPSESVTFDYKRFLEAEGALHPVKVKRWLKAYEKRTKRKGYAAIKIKNK